MVLPYGIFFNKEGVPKKTFFYGSPAEVLIIIEACLGFLIIWNNELFFKEIKIIWIFILKI